jgi:hypothetical protein
MVGLMDGRSRANWLRRNENRPTSVGAISAPDSQVATASPNTVRNVGLARSTNNCAGVKL